MAPSDHQETVDKEVLEIQRDIKRVGEPNADGKYVVKFGVLFEDEKVEQFYEVRRKPPSLSTTSHLSPAPPLARAIARTGTLKSSAC